ncbi:ThuA domain-containing protein [Luteimonas aquatica]|uniref:ThuA domain-containing protein n=1 Tax=Luteimonas aquatica TaxID=450364 RepID=UPI001F5885B7|nr:ThuA domain-containing protein [Luteimonas aquatica]
MSARVAGGAARAAVCVLWLLACLALPSGAAPRTRPAAAEVLYFTYSAGYRHKVVPESERILSKLGEESGRMRVTVSHDPAILDAARLARFDVVVFYTTGELPIDARQKRDLLAFVEDGKGFVGIHSASDTFYQWPEYGRMLGGYFDEHPWNQQVTVRVEDRRHPATRHLSRRLDIADEIYQFKDWSRADVHVLLRLDTASVDLAHPKVHRKDGDFALAWTRAQGRGRVFYTALGHRPEVWRDPRFQHLLLGAVQWAAGE